MYEIKVITRFAAAHNLENFKGRCEALHGHNWRVEARVVANTLDKAGVVVDFSDLKAALKEVLETIDHTYLNDHPFFKQNNPSSENIARYIFDELQKRMAGEGIKVASVSAWESEDACATYFGEES